MKMLGQMMKQAEAMQQRMAEMQETLQQTEVEGQSGGGLVKVTMTAKGEMRRVTIAPALADPAEIGVLEDLIVAACNDARARGDRLVAEEMQKLTGGLNLPPGFKLPF
ncbi:MAG: YbaB/EbfC family nucleoid-associated protein [Thalassobaculales bacterium]